MAQARELDPPPKGSISKYNELLYKDDAYSKPKWRYIQSIADYRNEAAHGQDSTVTFQDVQNIHAFVQRFIAEA